MISNEISALVGFACEATLYGVYCVLFVMSMAILIWRRRTRELNTAMIFANVVLFVCCTIHYALEFNHFYNRLQSNGLPNFADETHVLFAADIFLSLADFLGDMVLIYRCWLVWGKNYYIIILPFLTALSGFICAMEVLHLLLGIDPSAPVPPAVLVPLGMAGYTLPLCTNALITALIVGRIYYTSRGLKLDEVQPGYNSGHGAAERAMSIVIESGGLYLVIQFIFVVLYGLKHPAVAIMGVVAVQIYGIAPTLIIIRVGLGISTDQTTNATQTHIKWGRPGAAATAQTGSFGQSTTRFTGESGVVFSEGLELSRRKSAQSGEKSELSKGQLALPQVGA